MMAMITGRLLAQTTIMMDVLSKLYDEDVEPGSSTEKKFEFLKRLKIKKEDYDK